MFKRCQASTGKPIPFTIEGRSAVAEEGDTVAIALLSNGVVTCRSSAVSKEPRAPYCLMGVCFECLVEINGVGNKQACLTPLTIGMDIKMQNGKRVVSETSVETDDTQ